MDIGDIKLAYRKLKQLVYYDKSDLHLRQRLAKFECDVNFNKKIESIATIINSENPTNKISFKKWLNEINYRVVPKNIESTDPAEPKNEGRGANGKFISNVTSMEIIEIERVNYFFDGPIELHIIAVLWIIQEGCFLDSQLGNECYGSRLDKSVGKSNDRSGRLFRRYHKFYSQWRDSGIQKAKQLLTEEHKNVCILGLDIQEYYYHINLNFPSIARAIYREKSKETDSEHGELNQLPSKLLKCLEAIHMTYCNRLQTSLSITHNKLPNPKACLPIGLCSSPLLADWYLRNFDKIIMSLVKPAYYGRYVDDILLVITSTEDPSRQGKNPVEAFIDNSLVKSGVLKKIDNQRYEILKPGNLFLQQKKCILQYFEAKHSIAGLEKFQKKLEENSSSFLLLPVEGMDNSLEEVAYELLYEGSVNKFRSVKGISENRYELSIHLSKQIILHLLTNDLFDSKASLELRKFFKGKNSIEFRDLWERVFIFFLASKDSRGSDIFTKELTAEIKRISYRNDSKITKLLKDDLEQHLKLCQSMAQTLNEPISKIEKYDKNNPCFAFLKANLIRHNFIKLPLLNYTNFKGSLLISNCDGDLEMDPLKIEYSPRYVYFDECMLLAKSHNLNTSNHSSFEWAKILYESINNDQVDNDMSWEMIEDK